MHFMTNKMSKALQAEEELGSAEMVFDAIRDRIHGGRLVPGQRLIEADLVAELGTNRSRLRQAFRQLESEGLIKIDRNRGASVRKISREELVNTLEVMQAISHLIVEKAASRHADPEAQGVLDEALKQAREFRELIATTREPRRFMDENGRFWDALDSIHGNPVLSDMRRRLETTLYRLSLDGLVTTDKERWISLHEDLLIAIMKGDKKRSRKITEQSVRDRLDAILALPNNAFAW